MGRKNSNKIIPKKSAKKSPKMQSSKSPKTMSEGEKINRKELVDIAKEYKISHTGKKINVICQELVEKGAPLKCKSPRVVLRIQKESKPKKENKSPKKVTKTSKNKSPKKVTKKSTKDKTSGVQMKNIKLKDNETLSNIECIAIDQKFSDGKEISYVENKKNTKSYNMAKNWLNFFQNYSFILIVAHIKVVKEEEHSKLTTYRNQTLYSKGSIIDSEDL